MYLFIYLFIYSKQTEGPETATNTILKIQNNVRATRALLVKIDIEQSFFQSATVGEQTTELGKRFHTFTILLVTKYLVASIVRNSFDNL